MAEFRKGFSNFFPDIINEERQKRTLMLLFWNHQSNITTISEEKLVYGPKDLLAWLGGAFGIFVGYSFLDLAKQMIDITFYFVYRVIKKESKRKLPYLRHQRARVQYTPNGRFL